MVSNDIPDPPLHLHIRVRVSYCRRQLHYADPTCCHNYGPSPTHDTRRPRSYNTMEHGDFKYSPVPESFERHIRKRAYLYGRSVRGVVASYRPVILWLSKDGHFPSCRHGKQRKISRGQIERKNDRLEHRRRYRNAVRLFKPSKGGGRKVYGFLNGRNAQSERYRVN